MNITRIILDGIAMLLVFNMTVGMFWFIMPHAYSVMLPKEIKEKAGKVSKKEISDILPDVSPTTIEAVLGSMVKANKIQIIGYGRNTKYMKK